MNGNIVIMNFSGAYEAQDFYRDYDVIWIDLRDIQGTNCYCDREGEEAVREALTGLGPEGLHFLDSGNYHYATKIWLDKIEEEFELLVFDHHTDMQTPAFGDILSCGGWVRQALDGNPLLKKVYLAGTPKPPESELPGPPKPPEFELPGPPKPPESLEPPKLPYPTVLPDPDQPEFGGTDEKTYGERLTWIGGEKLKKGEIGSVLSGSGRPLYISFDKDILGSADAVTNWDQGQAELSDVLDCVREAAAFRHIIGVDVCGEDPEGPEQGRARAVNVNNRANGVIVCEFCKIPWKERETIV